MKHGQLPFCQIRFQERQEPQPNFQERYQEFQEWDSSSEEDQENDFVDYRRRRVPREEIAMITR